MDPCHAQKNASNPRLSRLGELMARAAARKRRARQMDTPVEDSLPPSDPFEELFMQHTELSIGELMNLTGQSRTTVHRRLVELVETGLLERRGAGRASRYHRTHN